MSAYHLSDGQMKWNGRFVSILRTETLKQICTQPGCQLPHQGQRGELQVGFQTSGVSAGVQLGPSILGVAGTPWGSALPLPLLGRVLFDRQAIGVLGPEGVESFQVVRPGEREGGSLQGTAEGGETAWSPAVHSSVPGAHSPPARHSRSSGKSPSRSSREAITLVETSFLWPGLVTWLGGDQRQAGPQVWASLP